MKYVLVTIFGVFISLYVGLLFIPKASGDVPVLKEIKEASIFQIGAFNILEDATSLANQYKGQVFNIDSKYYVYLSVLCNKSNIDRLTKYLEKNNIEYFIKHKSIDDDFFQELYKYEELMLNSTSDVAFLELNKKVINIYKENYEN